MMTSSLHNSFGLQACPRCSQAFDRAPEEQAFLQKISPVVNPENPRVRMDEELRERIGRLPEECKKCTPLL